MLTVNKVTFLCRLEKMPKPQEMIIIADINYYNYYTLSNSYFISINILDILDCEPSSGEIQGNVSASSCPSPWTETTFLPTTASTSYHSPPAPDEATKKNTTVISDDPALWPSVNDNEARCQIVKKGPVQITDFDFP
ncbi:hypothetical protein ILYODFUR_027895 [Ilyodon furcidens]|uniref:Uncharacterized protein n=1 Tax=Ilyodon furcidens TaxID=33524 RepID=A0ABV0UY63_9TELE